MSNEKTIPAINIRNLAGLNRAMHELEGKIYDLFEAGKFPGKKANKLLECLNQTRVMQQYFIKTADQQGFVELNAQNESYLAEGFMALHLVIFSVGEVSQ